MQYYIVMSGYLKSLLNLRFRRISELNNTFTMNLNLHNIFFRVSAILGSELDTCIAICKRLEKKCNNVLISIIFVSVFSRRRRMAKPYN